MRVAVTGVTGFLGGHLLERLLGDGHAVVAVIRDRARGAVLAERGVTVLHGDLSQPIAVPPDMQADVFVHVAGLSSNWGARKAFTAANVTGTETALELARHLGVRRFVHISSPSVYFRFADQFGLGEDAPLPEPVNAYAESKRLAEERVLAAVDLRPLILRPRGIYGRGDSALLPRLIRAAQRGPLPLLRDGVAVTDLTHVDDVVGGVLAAIGAPERVVGQVYNLSGGEPLRVVSIIEQACERVGVRPKWRRLPAALALGGVGLVERVHTILPGRPEPVATRYSLGVLAYSQTLDISRAAAELGWRPHISFDEGLRRL